MRTPITRSLVAVGVLGALALGARQLGLIGAVPGSRATALPLSCRIKGHGWRMPRNNTQQPIRRTCARCDQVEVALP